MAEKNILVEVYPRSGGDYWGEAQVSPDGQITIQAIQCLPQRDSPDGGLVLGLLLTKQADEPLSGFYVRCFAQEPSFGPTGPLDWSHAYLSNAEAWQREAGEFLIISEWRHEDPVTQVVRRRVNQSLSSPSKAELAWSQTPDFQRALEAHFERESTVRRFP